MPSPPMKARSFGVGTTGGEASGLNSATEVGGGAAASPPAARSRAGRDEGDGGEREHEEREHEARRMRHGDASPFRHGHGECARNRQVTLSDEKRAGYVAERSCDARAISTSRRTPFGGVPRYEARTEVRDERTAGFRRNGQGRSWVKTRFAKDAIVREEIALRLTLEAMRQSQRAVVGLLALPASVALGVAATVSYAAAFLERGFQTFELVAVADGARRAPADDRARRRRARCSPAPASRKTSSPKPPARKRSSSAARAALHSTAPRFCATPGEGGSLHIAPSVQRTPSRLPR